MDFDVYLQKNVFDVCGMKSSGYFEFDRLPARCAYGYLYASDNDNFRTNIYSVSARRIMYDKKTNREDSEQLANCENVYIKGQNIIIKSMKVVE